MLTSGIRSGEARVLQWKHIVWDQQGILIVQAQKANKAIGEPKAKEIRAVIVPKRTITLLKWWLEQTLYKLPEDYIFPGINTAGRNLVAHSLRHTYNTIWIFEVLYHDPLADFLNTVWFH